MAKYIDVEYILKEELLNYMEYTKIYDDIKDKTKQFDTITYKDTELFDFVNYLEPMIVTCKVIDWDE